MKPLFKVFLLSRPKEQGFVIPVVIALGLIMTLVGTISIFQSSDEQITATSQRATAKALAAAEIGVTRYRELIDSNKIIALYDACIDINNDGDTDDSNEWAGGTTCNNPSGRVNWANENIPNIGASCLATSAATVKGMATRGWRNIDASNPEDGQYRLIDYTYTSNYDDNSTPLDPSDDSYTDQPTGTLIVEGRVNQNNTNVARDAQAAVTRVVVDLPIQPGIPHPDGQYIELVGNFNNFHPALWIAGDAEGVTNNSSLKVDGNIVVTDTDGCELTGSTVMTTDNLNDPNTQSIILTPIQPSNKSFVLSGATNLDRDSDVDVNVLTNTDINNGITLPRSSDKSDHKDDNNNNKVDADEEVYYHYLVTGDINLTNDSIKILAKRKVILYLIDGDITLTANGSSNSVDINSDNPSYFLEIYGGNFTDEITLKGVNGKINIKALIHAPDATVKIENDPKITITGAVWVKDWNGKSLTTAVNIKPDSQAVDQEIKEEEISQQYYNYTYIRDDLTSSNARVVDPVISVPSRWETQQAE